MAMKHIFISYAKEDIKSALEIYNLLEKHGFSVWMDKKNLLPGQDWKVEIEKAIQTSEVFIACLSGNSVTKKGFVQSELKKALEILETIPEGDLFIIPVRLDECIVPTALSKLHWLNYFESEAKGDLFGAIQYHMKFVEQTSKQRSPEEDKEWFDELFQRVNLTDNRKQVIEYLYLYNNSPEETAKKMRKPVGAIYALQFHALQDIRKVLGNMEEMIQKLQKGSSTERIEAAKALGNLDDSRAIVALKEVLNSLTEPYDEDIIIPGGWGDYYDTHPEQTKTHDPDKELREAIQDALRKLQ